MEAAIRKKLEVTEESIRITAVGDMMLGEGIQKIGNGVRTRWSGSQTGALLHHLRPHLAADLCVGNLECMLGGLEVNDPSRMTYIGDPRHLSGLKDLGFTHLTLANNHILDQGEERAHETQHFVEAEGFTACSLPNPKRTMCKRRSVDLFCYNLIKDHDDPHFYRDRVGEEELGAMKRSDAFLKIVCIHWGNEFSEYPSPDQIELAHRMVDNGAHLILGHHPHVIQGAETYRGGLIVYSLGNFIFDMDWGAKTQSGFILQVDFKPDRSFTYRQVFTQQDRDYVPRAGEISSSTRKACENVLRFQNDTKGYKRYASRQLRLSRIKAILHMLRNARKVSIHTWNMVGAKRMRTLQQVIGRLKDGFERKKTVYE
jgi:poly-gamma-glutamate synthesis protein (capsule biosynthesis protein)